MAKKLNTEMFKSYDIRTRQTEFDDEIENRLADAVAVFMKRYLKVKSIVICRDARLGVPSVAGTLTEKLTLSGFDVFLNPNPVSSCQFYYTCMQHRTSAGIMCTASHNPGEYIGMKFVGKNLVPISLESTGGNGLEKLKEIYVKGECISPTGGKGKITVVNELDSYIDYSMKLAGVSEGSLKGLSLMFEFLNGSAGLEEALAFQKAGAKVFFRHIIPDGFFPCGDPNPIIESSIAPAREYMKKEKFDLGFCFDGDGDRMDIMDSEGRQIVPSLNMSFLLPYLSNEIFRSKKHIYTDSKALPTSWVAIAKTGIEPHLILNGHSFIKTKLRKTFKDGYFAAVEESAHYYMCFPYDLKKQTGRITDYAVTESTLFYALLTARCCKEHRVLYKNSYGNTKVFREREWSVHFDENPSAMKKVQNDIRNILLKEGAFTIRQMDDGTKLDSTLIRYNLPVSYSENTELKSTWYQLSMRVSKSEENLIRFEVSSNSKSECKRIKKITDKAVSTALVRNR